MKIAQLVVEGENIKSIIDTLYKHHDESQVGKPHMYSADNITVLMREEYYLRIGSTLMTVIFLKFIDDSKVEIELVVSGGKSGAFMYTWGAENSENRSIVNEIMDICTTNSWEITSIQPEDLMVSLTKSTINKIRETILGRFRK